MKAFLLVALLLAVPAGAQVVPDEIPDHGESMADRVRRDLVERHREFLSGLYAESALAVGPLLGEPAVYGAVALEGGYRFMGGHAIALEASALQPLDVDPVTGAPSGAFAASLGTHVSLAVGRRLAEQGFLRRAELGVGAAYTVVDDLAGARTTLSITPRLPIPLTPVLSLPVGLRLSQEVGTGRGPFVGLTLGVRRIWADEARMVLE